MSLCLIKKRLNFTSNSLDQNKPKSNLLVQGWVDLYQRFWSRSKNSQSRVLSGLKALGFSLEFLHLIIHSCSVFKHEFQTWSYLVNLIDTLTASSHYFCGSYIRATDENLNFHIRAPRVWYIYTNKQFLNYFAHFLSGHFQIWVNLNRRFVFCRSVVQF